MTEPLANTETKKPSEPNLAPPQDIDILSWLSFAFDLKSPQNLEKALKDPVFGSSFYNNLEKLGPSDRALTEIKTKMGLGPLKAEGDLNLEITKLQNSYQMHLSGNGKAELAMGLGKKSLPLLDSLAFVGLGGGLELNFENKNEIFDVLHTIKALPEIFSKGTLFDKLLLSEDLLDPKSWVNFKKQITAFHWDESLGVSFATKLKTFLPKLPLSANLQAHDSNRIDVKENKFLSKTIFSGGVLESDPAGLILESEFDLPKDFDFEKLKSHPVAEITKLLQDLEKSQKTTVKIFREKQTKDQKETHTYTLKKSLKEKTREQILKEFLTGDFAKAFQTALSSELVEKEETQKYRVFEKTKTTEIGHPSLAGFKIQYKQAIEDLNADHGPFDFDNQFSSTP